MKLDTTELAITYSALEECLNSDGFDPLTNQLEEIMGKIKLELKKPRQ